MSKDMKNSMAETIDKLHILLHISRQTLAKLNKPTESLSEPDFHVAWKSLGFFYCYCEIISYLILIAHAIIKESMFLAQNGR